MKALNSDSVYDLELLLLLEFGRPELNRLIIIYIYIAVFVAIGCLEAVVVGVQSVLCTRSMRNNLKKNIQFGTV